ncbi:IS4 family transposase [Paludisphaera sp.]|uniref:IS4 family transposase n=1 Tax=Paludisphaera sp. TaxID=2017432 RepID=UPI00301D32FD
MDPFQGDAHAWAREQFGTADLGDQRRTKRLTRVAARMAADPSASIPGQMEGWAEAKAAYRLLDADGVTFEAVAAPHWRRTRACGPGLFLVLGDTTELDFGIHRRVPDLAPTGNGGGYGFHLHAALVVGAEDERVIGLAGERVHYRKPAPAGENTSQRLKRDRESDVWGEVIDQVSPPAAVTRWVHVLDRGADNFDVYCHCRRQRSEWVVRASMLHRKVADPGGDVTTVRDLGASSQEAGGFTLRLRARPKQPARRARLMVRFTAMTMPVPWNKSRYTRQVAATPVPMWLVVAAEVDCPRGVKPIEWVLYTSLPVPSLEEAMRVISFYEKRWLVEEYFKALKSGCRVAERQLKTKGRLEALVGLLSVVAVRLLQLKAHARTDPDRPAAEVVPPRYVNLLRFARGFSPATTLTVGRFFRELAKLGGFLGRKHDGEPGWITIWCGWDKLQLMMRGAEAAADLGPEPLNSG